MVSGKEKGKGGGQGSSVGQALLRQRFQRKKGFKNANDGVQHLQGVEVPGSSPVLASVVDHSDLDDLLQTAELAGREFAAVRGGASEIVFQNSDAAASFGKLSLQERDLRARQRDEEDKNRQYLTIPRRPKWSTTMSAEELDAQEKAAFLEWRRTLARVEENERLVLTPFEKNLDIWRQLWRVLERSDLVVTVVDCRNPLFYHCQDLEAYVREIDPSKETMLLLNKADLLPLEARRKWALYFTQNSIQFCFWSAKKATEEGEGEDEEDEDDGEEEEVDEENVRVLNRSQLLHHLQAKASAITSKRGSSSSTTRKLQTSSSASQGPSPPHPAMVGFVGYPNVGKSSTINALVGAKKTGVTSTPGKTKHFQTLLISDSLTLCDCPGLVFPSFSSSRAEMVAAGVLPIDRMTDQRGPVEIVARRISRSQFKAVYAISIPLPAAHEPADRPPTAAEVMRSFCASRGLVASSGLPDETRASRHILKDFLSGRLLHYFLPPGSEEEEAPDGSEEEVGGEEGEEREGDEEDGEEEDVDGLKEAQGSQGEKGHAEEIVIPRNMNVSAGGIISLRDEEGVDMDIFADETVLKKPKPAKAAHKMHKKTARKKDRMWRVGNDGSEGMPVVKGVSLPVSHGAAVRVRVLPSERSIIGS